MYQQVSGLQRDCLGNAPFARYGCFVCFSTNYNSDDPDAKGTFYYIRVMDKHGPFGYGMRTDYTSDKDLAIKTVKRLQDGDVSLTLAFSHYDPIFGEQL